MGHAVGMMRCMKAISVVSCSCM